MKRKNPIFGRQLVIPAGLAAVTALSGRIVYAQKPPERKRDTGAVQGTIRNAAGEAIADVKVRMEGNESSTAREVR